MHLIWKRMNYMKHIFSSQRHEVLRNFEILRLTNSSSNLPLSNIIQKQVKSSKILYIFGSKCDHVLCRAMTNSTEETLGPCHAKPNNSWFEKEFESLHTKTKHTNI